MVVSLFSKKLSKFTLFKNSNKIKLKSSLKLHFPVVKCKKYEMHPFFYFSTKGFNSSDIVAHWTLDGTDSDVK